MQYVATAKSWLIDFAVTPGRIIQFAKYIAVSAGSLIVDVTVFGILVWMSAMGAVAAGAIGFSAGLVAHYILAVNFVFDQSQTTKSNRQLFIEYATTGAVGIAMTTAIIWISVDLLGLHPALGKLFAFGPTFVVVYLMRAAIVFAPSKPQAAVTV